jgi:hypothetical protein
VRVIKALCRLLSKKVMYYIAIYDKHVTPVFIDIQIIFRSLNFKQCHLLQLSPCFQFFDTDWINIDKVLTMFEKLQLSTKWLHNVQRTIETLEENEKQFRSLYKEDPDTLKQLKAKVRYIKTYSEVED